MKIILYIFVLILIATPSFSQKGEITGTVCYSDCPETLLYVSVFLISGSDTIVQEPNYSGQFTFTNLKYGSYHLYYRHIGYNSKDTLVVLKTKVLNLQLELKSDYPQEWITDPIVDFKFLSAPTSSSVYIYQINTDSIMLTQKSTIWGEKSEKALRVDTSQYIHILNTKEKHRVQEIINEYHLDSVGLYTQRTTTWGYEWHIKIEQADIIFSIDLPNYHNQGLEELLNYCASLIPKRKKSRRTR